MSVESSQEGNTSRQKIGLTDRWLWILLPPTLALLPFGNAIREGELAGSGPDVISSVWAMWWFQQEWFSGAWGVPSTVFNFPWGGQGAILSPLSALCWSLLDVGFGPAWATTICNWVVLTISMLSLMFLGKQLGLNKLALGAMGLVCVVSRYMVFTLGETGTVGVACLPLIWGLTAYYNNIERQSNALWIVVMLMMGLQGLENPYLAPVLPVFLLLEMCIHRTWRGWKWLLGGLAVMGMVMLLFKGASGDYESVRPTGYTQLFGLHFSAIERPWARTEWLSLIQPRSVLWPSGSMDSIHMQGREYLGFSTLLVLFCGLWIRQTWIWIMASAFGLLLVTGSDWGGFPSLFGLLNSIADVLLRPFTQPSRYFVLFTLGASVTTGLLVQRLGRNGIWVWVLLLGDALWFGGLSLRIPTTTVPDLSCVSNDKLDGPVLVWPWDGADDQWFESSLKSRLFQMVHEQSGATIATGSWALEGVVFPGKRLRDIGWRQAMDGRGALDTGQLYAWGYRYVIVDETAGRVLARRARNDIFGVDNQIIDCPTIDVYQIMPR